MECGTQMIGRYYEASLVNKYNLILRGSSVGLRPRMHPKISDQKLFYRTKG